MKHRIGSLAAAFNLAVLLALSTYSLASAAGAPRLYVQPANLTAHAGQDMTVPVRLNANGTAVNALDVHVTFPNDQMTFMGVSKAGSFFDTMVPATPSSSDGKLEFSVASLNTSTSGDVLVASLLFQTKASTGTGKITLDGSNVANDGHNVASTNAGASISFSSGSGSASGVGITNLNITGITVNAATVRWHTDVPASSEVDYGSTTNYGFTAGSDTLTSDHVVALGQVFSGNATVHVRVTSVAANGDSQISGDKSFQTKGYSVVINVKDATGATLSGAEVSVAGSAAVKADASGVARVDNVAPGNQKVVINGGKAQFIAIKAVKGTAAVKQQQFSLQAEKSRAVWWPIGLLVVVILVVAGVWLWRSRAHQDQPSK